MAEFEALCEQNFYVCISVLRVASGPRVKLAGRKSALTHPTRVVYSTDRSKAVVLALFLHFVALYSFVVPALLFVFCICVMMLALWSPSSIAAHFAFCFTSCVVLLAYWSPSTAAYFAFCFISCD